MLAAYRATENEGCGAREPPWCLHGCPSRGAEHAQGFDIPISALGDSDPLPVEEDHATLLDEHNGPVLATGKNDALDRDEVVRDVDVRREALGQLRGDQLRRSESSRRADSPRSRPRSFGYKAANPQPKDHSDYSAVLPSLGEQRIKRLTAALALAYPGHAALASGSSPGRAMLEYTLSAK